jgi:ribosomal protein S27AE
VCGYCQSTVVRSGDKLARIGKMAELFDDHTPLQLQASGVWTIGGVKKPFTLVGRLQYKYGEGTWTEWHAVLMDGTSAYLSEDNGAYVFTVPLESRPDIPAPEQLRVGARIRLNGNAFVVGSNQPVSLISAQGELPRLPKLGEPFAMVELRTEGVGAGGKSAAPDAGGARDASNSIIGRALDKSAAGTNPVPAAGADGNQVLSIDYSSTPPGLSLGATVLLEDLQLTGLKDESAKDEKGRQFACPNCGASVSVTLATSKSITCGSCHSLIDVSGGIGGELKSAIQDEPVQPLIPLGRIGQLQGVAWQVVGFQHRMGTDPADPDEHFGWDEYLLYNQKRGFTFLVDSTEGWSIVKPATGAPLVAQGGASATYLGVRYQLKESYKATTTYVAGEFYWQVSRGQTTKNRDYASGKSMLSMEESSTELTWSVGGQIASEAVAAAFKLDDKKDLLKRADAGPAAKGVGCLTIVIILVVVLLLLALMSRCSPACDPATQNCQSNSSSSSGARTSGGSYGGSIGGGGHK